ncbi:MAG: O-antigen ligase family protein [Vicinamibacterales bacterium]
MNAISKGVVILSTLLAAAVEINLAAYGFGPLLYVSTGGFALTFLMSPRLRGVITRASLFAIYLTPALLLIWAGRDHTSYEMAWIGPLLGLVLSGRGALTWHLPRPLRLPLVVWALIVSVSAPIVMLREVGFAPWIFNLARVSNTSIGISPNESISWVAYVVLGHNLGVLWLDWLYRCYAEDRTALRKEVLAPLAAGACLACVVGVYQGFVDLQFLSGHVWPHMRRAAGTLMDANAFGMVAALWAPGFVALAYMLTGPLSAIVGAGGLALAFIGVYTSGSRTALIALSISMVAVAYQGWCAWRSAASGSRPLAKRLLVATLVVAGAAGLVVLVARGTSTVSVIARGSLGFLPIIGDLGPREVSRQLWDRFGYGRTATLMIQENPWSGVGVGSFLTLAHDYAGALGLDLPPDNAQNWFRQQLAELGILGSLAWLAWCVLFFRASISRARDDAAAPVARLLRGSLIAFGIVSFVGVAGQANPIVITFWTFAFWFLTCVTWPAPGSETARAVAWRPAWAAVLVIVGIHAATTFASARGDLLPQNRAQRFGWYYRYGLHDLERSRDGGRGRIWTMKKSLAVIPVQGRVLKFVCWNDHPDADPLAVKIWADSKLVLSTELRKGESAAIDIPAATGERRMIIETWVSRTFQPSDYGSADTRELGLAMADWLWEP